MDGEFLFRHQFKLLKNKLDITPGVSLNYMTEFDLNVFLGSMLDIILIKILIFTLTWATSNLPTMIYFTREVEILEMKI